MDYQHLLNEVNRLKELKKRLLTKDNKYVNDQCNILDNKISELEKQLYSTNIEKNLDNIDLLKDSNIQKKIEINKIIENNKCLDKQIEDLSIFNQEKKDIIKLKEQELHLNQKTLDTILSNNNKVLNQIEDEKNKVISNFNKIEIKNNEISALKNLFEKINNEKFNYLEKLNYYFEINKKTLNEIDNLEIIINENKNKLIDLRNKKKDIINEKNNYISNLKTINETKNQLINTNSDILNKINSLENYIKNIQNRIDIINNNIENSKDEILKITNNDLHQEFIYLSDQKNNLDKEYNNLSSIDQDLSKKLSQLKISIDKNQWLKNENNKLLIEIKTKNIKLEELEKQHNKYQESLTIYNNLILQRDNLDKSIKIYSNHKNLDIVIKNLEKEIENKKTIYDKLNILNKEKINLDTIINNFQNNNNIKNLQELEKTINDLKNKITEYQKLKDKLDILNKDKIKIDSEIKTKNIKLEELEKLDKNYNESLTIYNNLILQRDNLDKSIKIYSNHKNLDIVIKNLEKEIENKKTIYDKLNILNKEKINLDTIINNFQNNNNIKNLQELEKTINDLKNKITEYQKLKDKLDILNKDKIKIDSEIKTKNIKLEELEKLDKNYNELLTIYNNNLKENNIISNKIKNLNSVEKSYNDMKNKYTDISIKLKENQEKLNLYNKLNNEYQIIYKNYQDNKQKYDELNLLFEKNKDIENKYKNIINLNEFYERKIREFMNLKLNDKISDNEVLLFEVNKKCQKNKLFFEKLEQTITTLKIMDSKMERYLITLIDRYNFVKNKDIIIYSDQFLNYIDKLINSNTIINLNIDNEYKENDYTLIYMLNNNGYNTILFNDYIRNIKHKKTGIIIDIDFYKKAHYLEKYDNIFEEILNKGVIEGYLYTPRQFYKLFPNNKLINQNGNIYTNNDDNLINLKDFLKDNLYNKDFDYFINQFEILESYLDISNIDTSNIDLFLFVFIGYRNRGVDIINKINKYYEIEKYKCVIILNNRDNYDLINKINCKERIVYLTNDYGNDIIPTLIAFNDINKKIQLNYIIKLQTKNNLNFFNCATNYLLNKDLSKLKTLLIDSKMNTIGHPNYIGSIETDKFYNSLLMIKYQNYVNINKNFIGGTMFFCHKITFDKIIDFMKNNNYKSYFTNNLYDTNSVNKLASPVHFIERLFGLII
jgi:hypothetical protein